MTAWTYSTLVSALDNYLQQDSSQPGTTQFASAIPTFISNAEQRIYRELDFLSTRQQVANAVFTAGSRTLSLSTLVSGSNSYPQYPITVQGIAAILPACGVASEGCGAFPTSFGCMPSFFPAIPTTPAQGTRVQYELTSLDYIDMVWPTESITAAPSEGFAYFAMQTDQVAVVAPTPDRSYTVEVTGTFRPVGMSSSTPMTWLGDNLPDLLFYACMIEATGYLRDYGASSDDPRLAVSWDKRYSDSRASAMVEESRRKGEGVGWTPYSPSSMAQPPRM